MTYLLSSKVLSDDFQPKQYRFYFTYMPTPHCLFFDGQVSRFLTVLIDETLILSLSILSSGRVRYGPSLDLKRKSLQLWRVDTELGVEQSRHSGIIKLSVCYALRDFGSCSPQRVGKVDSY